MLSVTGAIPPKFDELSRQAQERAAPKFRLGELGYRSVKSITFGDSANHLFVGNFVRMRQVVPADYANIYAIETASDALILSRSNGATLPAEDHIRALFSGSLAVFTFDTDMDRAVGFAACYGADFRNGHAKISIGFGQNFRRSVYAAEGFDLFVRYCFDVFSFRKLYFETNALIAAQFPSAIDRVFHVEATLKDHLLILGDRVDHMVLSLFREEWPGVTGELRQGLGRLERRVNDTNVALSLEQFIGLVRQRFCLPSTVDSDSQLSGVWDSLLALEIFYFLQEICEDEVPHSAVASLETLRDVYHLYAAYRL